MKHPVPTLLTILLGPILVMAQTACNRPTDASAPASAAPFTIVETGVPELQAALQSRRITSRQLVTQYLARIATYEDRINAIITVNPRALDEADAMDRERAAGRVRGPLHGIPIALKDNIHTTDIRTTGGALAFRDLMPPYDATLTKNLRDGGADHHRQDRPHRAGPLDRGRTDADGGQLHRRRRLCVQPVRPAARPAAGDVRPARCCRPAGRAPARARRPASGRPASGSDTGGSIISPSNANMLAGIRPTIGRISRYGVIPITADHDTAGPMARTVTDAAILMGVLESAAPDPNDAATKACTPPPNRDYTAFLDAGALKGARIGIPRAFYYDKVKAPGDEARPDFKDGRGGLSPEQAKVMEEAIAILKAQGAEVIDPVEVPSLVSKDPASNFLLFDYCQGAEHKRGGDANCTVNFKYGMKRDFNAWLASLGDRAPVKTLTELREWNLAHAKDGAIRFGQSRLDISDEMDLERDRARNDADTAKDHRLSRDQGIDAVLKAHKLDAILTPGGSGANLASRAGYPIVAVPFGMVPNAPTPVLPAGFDAGRRRSASPSRPAPARSRG